jgi:hypothetical protein
MDDGERLPASRREKGSVWLKLLMYQDIEGQCVWKPKKVSGLAIAHVMRGSKWHMPYRHECLAIWRGG